MSLILVHIADNFVAYYKQVLVGQVEGLMAGWFVDILCLVHVYSMSGMVVMWHSSVQK